MFLVVGVAALLLLGLVGFGALQLLGGGEDPPVGGSGGSIDRPSPRAVEAADVAAVPEAEPEPVAGRSPWKRRRMRRPRRPPAPAEEPAEATPATPEPQAAAEDAAAEELRRRKRGRSRRNQDSSRSTTNAAGAGAAPQTAAGPWGATTAPAGTGRITVNTRPAGARVLVDGNAVGTAPWSGPVAQGNHTVRAELDGHKAAARSVEVGEGGLDINFTLRPVVVTGQVNIYGTPQAKVFIDGNPVGAIPVTALSEDRTSSRSRPVTGRPSPGSTTSRSASQGCPSPSR